MSRYFAIRFQDLIFIAVFAGALAAGDQMFSIDSDLGRHLTIGNYILAHQAVPTSDVFSHSLHGESRPPYEWLSQVLLSVANRWLGLDGVILLTGIVLGVSASILFQHSVRRSQSPVISLLTTLLAIAAMSIHWLPRPHIVTFLFLALWVDRLERMRLRESIHSLGFPLLMLVWANLHGGFIFGFLTLSAYIAGWLWDFHSRREDSQLGKQYFQIGISSLFASFLTPDLWRNWDAVLNNRSSFILSRTVETMPVNLSDPVVSPFILLLSLAVICLFANLRNVSAAHLFLLSGFGAMALLMMRNIPLFAIATAPILSAWISFTTNRVPRWKMLDDRFSTFSFINRFPILPFAAVVLAFGYFAFSHREGKIKYQFNPQVFPVHAVDWLEKNPIKGNIFNEFNWGGYLLYRTWPRHLVFIDSQSDFYGESLLRDYETMILAQEDRNILFDEYQIDWVLIPVQSPLAKNLSADSRWQVVYKDEVAIVITQK